MKKILKKGMIMLLLFSLLIPMVSDCFGFHSINVYAEEIREEGIDEQSGLPIVNEKIVRGRIFELCHAFGMSNVDFDNLREQRGAYFTYSGEKCSHGTYLKGSEEGHDNCKNSKVIKANWLTDKLVVPEGTSQLPGHFYPDNHWGYPVGSTCQGFANFALWYICKENSQSKVYPKEFEEKDTRLYDGVFLVSELKKADIRMGDILRIRDEDAYFSVGHSAVFLGYSDNCEEGCAEDGQCSHKMGIWVLDCNYLSSQIIGIHEIREDSSKVVAVTRGTNYVPDYKYEEESTETETPAQSDNSEGNSTALYYHYTDGKGNYSYCGGKICDGLINSIYAFFKKISVYKVEKNFNKDDLTMTANISHKKHWFSQKCDIRQSDLVVYRDKNNVPWYRINEPESDTSDIVIGNENESIPNIETSEKVEESVRVKGFVSWENAGLEDHTMIWGDEVLEKMMRSKTGIYNREIMLSDVWEIENLYLNNSPLDNPDIDIDGEFGQIRDASALGELNNLTSLDLNWSAISDISALCELTNLEELGLNGCPIGDFSGISNLKKLRQLELGKTGVSDISFLGELTYLEYLDLGINNITDISVLSNLPRLYHLNLCGNQITDISPLNAFSDMRYIDISDNPIINLSSVSFLKSETRYGNTNFVPRD